MALIQAEMTDHEFSKYLEENSWSGDCIHSENSTLYFSKEKTIAVVFTDESMVRKFYIRKE